MTMWIGGQSGLMVPTPCASDLSVSAASLRVDGGGLGTLAPPRSLFLGGRSFRSWQVRKGVSGLHEVAPLLALVDRQERTGEALRVIPCDAAHTNMLTPGASESLAGWSGAVTVGAATASAVEDEPATRTVLDPGTIIANDTVITASTLIVGPHFRREEIRVSREVYPATVVTVPSSTPSVVSPVTPALPSPASRKVTAGVFLASTSAAVVTVRLTAYTSTGFQAATTTQTVTTTSTLTRAVLGWTLPATAATWRMTLSSPTTFMVAWPSLAQAEQWERYHPGAGCERAVIDWPTRDLISTVPRDGLQALAYDVREVG